MRSKPPGRLAIIASSLPGVCRRHGTARALRLAASELLFDLRNGTDTSLDPPRHEATSPLLFRELVPRLPAQTLRGRFLDFGAGKGRALLLATRHGFPRVLGVEVSAELCEISARNIARFERRVPGAVIDVCHADAVDFQVPDDTSVGYFFNPFGPGVMCPVVDHISASLTQVPRPFHVVYMYPRFVEPFLRAGFTPVYRQGEHGMLLRRG
jgi:SAM-dependent methyltransferase